MVIEDSQHLVEQAAAELPLFPATWLRGLLPLEVPEPLSMHCNFNSSFSCFDVHGLIMAGDGSGGTSNVALSGRGFGCDVFGIMIGDGICLGSGCGFHIDILDVSRLGIDVQYVPVLGVDGGLAIGGNNGL